MCSCTWTPAAAAGRIWRPWRLLAISYAKVPKSASVDRVCGFRGLVLEELGMGTTWGVYRASKQRKGERENA